VECPADHPDVRFPTEVAAWEHIAAETMEAVERTRTAADHVRRDAAERMYQADMRHTLALAAWARAYHGLEAATRRGAS
jgi:hypothetical protein